MAWSIRVLVWVGGACLLAWSPVPTALPKARAQAKVVVVDAGATESAHDARGEEALKKALSRLSSSSAAERAEAADEMGRRGYRVRKQIAEALRPLLRADPDSVVRAAAGRALGRLGAREAVPELIQALGDKAVEVRVVAAAALWRLPDPSAVPALLERVKDEDRAVREWSALALGVAADPRAVPELIRLLGDPERPVRLAAVRSLGRINRVEGLKPLTRYLQSSRRDDEEKEEVVNSIASIEGTQRVGALLELLASPGNDQTQKQRLVNALAKVGDLQAISALRKLALSRDEAKAVREAANQAVAAIVARAKAPREAGPPAARP
jgi:HEAT repeat protein